MAGFLPRFLQLVVYHDSLLTRGFPRDGINAAMVARLEQETGGERHGACNAGTPPPPPCAFRSGAAAGFGQRAACSLSRCLLFVRPLRVFQTTGC